MSLTITSVVGSIAVSTDRDGDDYTTGGYSVEAWQPPALPITVDLDESNEADGAGMGGSRRKTVALPTRIRCTGANRDPDDALAKAVTLAQVVEIDDGTGWDGDPSLEIVDQITAASSCTHDCFRTAATIIVDRVALAQNGIVYVEFAPICRHQTWSLP